MKQVTALILEPSDFTKDGNLKKESFDAFSKSDLVVNNGVVIKTGATLVAQAVKETPVRRIRRRAVVVPPAETSTPDGV